MNLKNKIRKSLLTAMIGLAVSGTAFAMPTGGIPVTSNIDISNVSNGIITVNGTGVVNWQSFGIANGETLTFTLKNASILNRVTGSQVSEILGALKSQGTGSVILVNPNGIVVGPNATINAGSLLLSTLNMTDTDFQALINGGTAHFTAADGKTSAAIVVNNGAAINAENLLQMYGGTIQIADGVTMTSKGAQQNHNAEMNFIAANDITLSQGNDGLSNSIGSVKMSKDNTISMGKAEIDNQGADLSLKMVAGKIDLENTHISIDNLHRDDGKYHGELYFGAGNELDETSTAVTLKADVANTIKINNDANNETGITAGRHLTLNAGAIDLNNTELSAISGDVSIVAGTNTVIGGPQEIDLTADATSTVKMNQTNVLAGNTMTIAAGNVSAANTKLAVHAGNNDDAEIEVTAANKAKFIASTDGDAQDNGRSVDSASSDNKIVLDHTTIANLGADADGNVKDDTGTGLHINGGSIELIAPGFYLNNTDTKDGSTAGGIYIMAVKNISDAPYVDTGNNNGANADLIGVYSADSSNAVKIVGGKLYAGKDVVVLGGNVNISGTTLETTGNKNNANQGVGGVNVLATNSMNRAGNGDAAKFLFDTDTNNNVSLTDSTSIKTTERVLLGGSKVSIADSNITTGNQAGDELIIGIGTTVAIDGAASSVAVTSDTIPAGKTKSDYYTESNSIINTPNKILVLPSEGPVSPSDLSQNIAAGKQQMDEQLAKSKNAEDIRNVVNDLNAKYNSESDLNQLNGQVIGYLQSIENSNANSQNKVALEKAIVETYAPLNQTGVSAKNTLQKGTESNVKPNISGASIPASKDGSMSATVKVDSQKAE